MTLVHHYHPQICHSSPKLWPTAPPPTNAEQSRDRRKVVGVACLSVWHYRIWDREVRPYLHSQACEWLGSGGCGFTYWEGAAFVLQAQARVSGQYAWTHIGIFTHLKQSTLAATLTINHHLLLFWDATGEETCNCMWMLCQIKYCFYQVLAGQRAGKPSSLNDMTCGTAGAREGATGSSVMTSLYPQARSHMQDHVVTKTFRTRGARFVTFPSHENVLDGVVFSTQAAIELRYVHLIGLIKQHK